MPRRGQRRDPKRERFWRRTIQAWARSGDTIRGFCSQRGLSETGFHAWRRELRKRDRERVGAADGGASPVRSTAARRAGATAAAVLRPRFVPVRLTAGPGPIEIERNGTTIRLPGDVDAEVLVRVVEAVSRVSC